MTVQIALQLYSVREAANKDFEGAVRKVAAIGYDGVETAGYPGTTAVAAGKLFKELGLIACSAHTSLPLGDKKNQILDEMEAIDSKLLVTGIGPADAAELDKIKAACARMNEANQILKAKGIRQGVHNHWWEYEKLGNRYVYQIMAELLEPDILFELDTYWIKTAGVDPAKIVKEMGKRSPVLHIKDGPAMKGVPMTAVGKGVMDFPAIFAAAKGNLEWSIVELDACATDMFEAVEASFCYLKGTC